MPRAALALFGWDELERMVCGNPLITAEDIRVNCSFVNLERDDPVMGMLFDALRGFDPTELSLVLRFVTGRKRLPVRITIVADGRAPEDSLPKSYTCVNQLILPRYSGVARLAERVRYAIHNCVAIDTDTTPWQGE